MQCVAREPEGTHGSRKPVTGRFGGGLGMTGASTLVQLASRSSSASQPPHPSLPDPSRMEQLCCASNVTAASDCRQVLSGCAVQRGPTRGASGGTLALHHRLADGLLLRPLLPRARPHPAPPATRPQ